MDGTGDYVDCGDDDIFNFGTDDFSISAWVKENESTLTTRVIVNKGDFFKGFDVVTYGSDVVARIEDDTTNISISTAPEDILLDGEWHHVVAVYDRSDVITLYIDGVLKRTSDDISGIGDINNMQNLSIGAATNGDNSLNGSIDEVMIFNRILTAEEAAKLASRTQITDGRIGYWKFNEDFRDYSGYSHHGTAEGDAEIGVVETEDETGDNVKNVVEAYRTGATDKFLFAGTKGDKLLITHIEE